MYGRHVKPLVLHSVSQFYKKTTHFFASYVKLLQSSTLNLKSEANKMHSFTQNTHSVSMNKKHAQDGKRCLLCILIAKIKTILTLFWLFFIILFLLHRPATFVTFVSLQLFTNPLQTFSWPLHYANQSILYLRVSPFSCCCSATIAFFFSSSLYFFIDPNLCS